jgi:hypothetical protein
MDRNSLDVAAHCGQAEVLLFLLRHLQDRGLPVPKIGPLHWAAKEGHTGVVSILIR